MATVTGRPATAVMPASAFLPYRPEAASAARRLVRDKLAEWRLEHLADDAQLIVSELAANAAKTGCHRRMYVTIRRPAPLTVRIAVRDGSRTLPVLMQAGDCDAECGRGLGLVDRLTHGRWGVVPETLGKTTWADLAVAVNPAG
ncbi:anti-sigma regulatory factor (Ser/Thr protein kinase) [Kitasatospora sp. MAP12-15]|uniref:ATP-binding protein n=1 Tax=unclassified Kitasatospora TaxID=2633591 RepID=UPI0024739CAE|nr:ATP-binding protein [Kitasatospora sp. MAP12-44]MDH6112932.1 anti-sigma regulatory factor (Ser/Thr protein kinase) [Kitasatospora sp. MAP12-44]